MYISTGDKSTIGSLYLASALNDTLMHYGGWNTEACKGTGIKGYDADVDSY
jgi:hypothetical protein